MSEVRKRRVELNLTQDELAQKCGVSSRTIQRIESGAEPKGHTLNVLADALGLEIDDLRKYNVDVEQHDQFWLKLINISSLPFTILPPLNIITPLVIAIVKKEMNPLTKKLISLQILWTIGAVVIFMLASFSKNWFDLNSQFIMIVMILLVLSNLFLILRNAYEIDKNGKLYVDLNFSVI